MEKASKKKKKLTEGKTKPEEKTKCSKRVDSQTPEAWPPFDRPPKKEQRRKRPNYCVGRDS